MPKRKTRITAASGDEAKARETARNERKQVRLYPETAQLLDQITGFTRESYLGCLHRLLQQELRKRAPEMHEALSRLVELQQPPPPD